MQDHEIRDDIHRHRWGEEPAPRRPAFGLQVVAPCGDHVTVEEWEVGTGPFYRLVQFRGQDKPHSPPVLVVGAFSGQTSLLLHDLLAALAPDRDLYLLEWNDARDVPLAEGDFGMEDNITAVLKCIDHLGGELHLVGVCQSAMPCLAAAALRASLSKPEPISVTLFGGLIDPRINPTRIGRFAAERPLSWFRDYATASVPPFFRGGKRKVHPSYLQTAGLQAYMARHFSSGGELLFKVMNDDGSDALHYPFLTLYLSVMDLPATLYLDEIRLTFQEFALPQGRLSWKDVPVEPAAITRSALLTIEGGRDDVSGVGQTSAAHGLCSAIPAARRKHYLQPDTGHFGLFHGGVWRREILPQMNGFMRALE